MMRSGCDGRPVALVTGGGGDIGRAIALRLARMSKAVAIVDIDEHAAARDGAHLVEAAGCKAMRDPRRCLQSRGDRGFCRCGRAELRADRHLCQQCRDRRRGRAAA